jgi:hypothetical protein
MVGTAAWSRFSMETVPLQTMPAAILVGAVAGATNCSGRKPVVTWNPNKRL